jgi:hypothetical protein
MQARTAVLGVPPLVVAAALVTAVALAGCGLTAGPSPPLAGPSPPPAGPSPPAVARPAPARAAATLAQAQRTHEYPTPVPRQTVAGGWRSPVQAVRVFTATYINWTAATVSGRLRALAAVSVGQARSAMSLAAAQTGSDDELKRGGIANSGVVEAVAPLGGRRGQYAVVTRERTTAANTSAYRGLAATWHVSLATVTRVAGGLYVLSDWQPEN